MACYLIYGANGFSGKLIAQHAKTLQHQIILAGRNSVAIQQLAQELNLPYRVFDLEHEAALDAAIADVDAVLHAAGPFSKTALPMLNACIRQAKHYIDISGEYRVFQQCASYHTQAKSAGIMVLCGAGFDVTPTDCLAAHLKQRLPSGQHLTLGIHVDMIMSPGTAETIVESFGQPSMIRREGMLQHIPMGSKQQVIPFKTGEQMCVALPLGELFSVFYNNAIQNIEVFVSLPSPIRLAMRSSNLLPSILRSDNMQKIIKPLMRQSQRGPSSAQMQRGRSEVWAKLSDGRKFVVGRVFTPDHYVMTAQFACAAAQRAALGQVPTGYQTPASAFGADFILQFEGVTRVDD